MTGVVPGTLEFTTSTGLRYLRAPHRTTPAPPDLDDPLVATAVAHAGLGHARRAVDDARMTEQHAAIYRRRADKAADSSDEYDHEDRTWQAGLAAYRRQTTGRRDSTP